MSHYRGPAADHSLLSPSGRVSKRARAVALAREGARLFADVDWQPATAQPTEEQRLRDHAARLLDLAERGMSPRRFRKEAKQALERAEAQKNG